MDADFLKYIYKYIQTTLDEMDPQDRPEKNIIQDAFKAYIKGIKLGFAAKRKADLDNEINKVRKYVRIIKKTLDKNHWQNVNCITGIEFKAGRFITQES